jgi:O-antigen/teichoic acid export membrane protein
MDIKKFLSTISFSFIINIIIKVLWYFVIDLQFQNLVGNTQYGLYLKLLNISYIFTGILDIGLSTYININARENNSSNLFSISSLFTLKLILSIIYIILLLLIGIQNFKTINEISTLLILGTSFVFFWLNVFLRSIISGNQKFKIESIFGVLDKILLIILFLISINYFNLTIKIYAFFQVLCYLINFISLLLYISYYLKIKLFYYNIKFKSIVEIIVPCLKIFLYGSIISIILKIDIILMDRILDNKEQIGVYGGAMRILDAYQNIIMLLTTILIPIFSDNNNNKNKKIIRKFSAFFVVFLGLCLFGFSYFLGAKTLNIMYHTSNSEQNTVLVLLSFSSIFIGLFIVYNAILSGYKQFNAMIIISFISLIIHVTSNIFLIKSKAIIGSAFAFIITFAFMSISMLIFIEFYYDSKKD